MGDMRSGTASAGSSNKLGADSVSPFDLIMTFHGVSAFRHRQRGVAGHAKGVGAGLDQIQWISSVYLLTMRAFTRVRQVGRPVWEGPIFRDRRGDFSIGSLCAACRPRCRRSWRLARFRASAAHRPWRTIWASSWEAFPPVSAAARSACWRFVALGMMCGRCWAVFIVSMFPWRGIFSHQRAGRRLSLVIGHFTLPRSTPECAGQSHGSKGPVLLVPGMLLTFLSVTMMAGQREPRCRARARCQARSFSGVLRAARAPRRASTGQLAISDKSRGERRLLSVHQLRRHRCL